VQIPKLGESAQVAVCGPHALATESFQAEYVLRLEAHTRRDGCDGSKAWDIPELEVRTAEIYRPPKGTVHSRPLPRS
jgi:hypothetical protein